MSRKHRDKGRIEGPFIAVLKDSWRSLAWKAASAPTRLLYIALKDRYSFALRNNGRIYLSVRQAAKETGLDKNVIARGFRELQYYGFIVQTNPGCLGIDGHGKAPHWRLTELGYMTDPPTREFLHWGGEKFHEQKPPEYYKRQERRLTKLRTNYNRAPKKQNPVPTNGTPCPDQQDIPVSRPTGHSPAKLSRPTVHTADPACPDQQDISRLTTPPAESGHNAGPPLMTAPRCAGCVPDEIDWQRVAMPRDMSAYLPSWSDTALARSTSQLGYLVRLAEGTSARRQ